MQECVLEQKLVDFADRLSSPNSNTNGSNQIPEWYQNLQRQQQQNQQQLIPMFKDMKDGDMYKVTNGQLQAYKFEENISSLINTSSSDSFLGMVIGAASTGALGALVGKFGGSALGLGGNVLTALAAYLIMTKVLKSGFGHAIAKGWLLGSATAFAFPIVNQFTSGIVGASGA